MSILLGVNCTDKFKAFAEMVSDWENLAESIQLNVQIPVNSTAEIILPTKQLDQIFESGKSITVGNIFKTEQFQGKVKITIGSGNYSFMVRK